MASLATWSRLDVPHGLGQARFVVAADGIDVTAGEIIAGDEGHWTAAFRVALDTGWRTRAVEVTVTDTAGIRHRRLDATGAGAWLVDGDPAPELDGCLDIDIGAVPFTNTFVINRTRPAVGARVELTVAFVDVPSLEVQALQQRYRRVGESAWVYGDDEFGEYEITVDRDGVVLDYEGLAARVP